MSAKQSYKLQPKDKNEILARYQAGEKMADIARAYNVYPNTVRHVLAQNNVPLQRRKHDVHNISDYHLDILERACPPFEISLAEEHISKSALSYLEWGGLLRKSGAKIRNHSLYEITAKGLALLHEYGRSSWSEKHA